MSNIIERKSQISIGEIMAVALLLQQFGHFMMDASLALFVDNAGVFFTIVNGASRFSDLGSIAYGIQAQFTKMRILPWVEHEAPWSNPSDGGSRVGVGCEFAKTLLVPLRQCVLKILPGSFPCCAIDEWVEWFE